MSEITNPMWELVGRYPSSDWGLYDSDDSIASHPDLMAMLLEQKIGPHRPSRQWVSVTYAWAIADPDTLAFVAKHTASTGIVEIGAGTGYWAWMLTQLGVDVIAYDRFPPKTAHNFFHNTSNAGDYTPTGDERGEQYFKVRRGTHLMAAKHPDRTLFLSWPPGGSPMAARALARYAGDKVVFIGETGGGLTGDGSFFALLQDEWEPVDAHRIVQWEGIHDIVLVFERAVPDA